MSVPNGLRPIAAAVMEALFPTRCLACGAFFNPSGRSDAPAPDAPIEKIPDAPIAEPAKPALFRQVLNRHLCPDCAGDFGPVDSPLCSCCGLMFRSREGPNHPCGLCHSDPPRFAMARSFGLYDSALLTLIHRFKYNGKTGLSDPLGKLLFTEFRRWWVPEEIDLIAPVPLHIRRFRKRGYNQAYLLIRDWPRIASAAGMAPGAVVIDREALHRHRRTDHQVGMKREERDVNIRGAFSVPRPERITGRHVLLIDDVMTTGATADECARILRAAGAKQVDLLTLAQAPLLRPRRIR